eukprot:9986359-Lingulodinium_polyedra.AAC.1
MARSRVPCVQQKLLCARSARVCDLRAVATARGRFDRVVVYVSKRYTRMRSNRPSAAVAASKSHVHALHARARKPGRAWSMRACDLRAAAPADGRLNRIVV